MRIEAWRLLARCRVEAAARHEALDKAVEECRKAGYAFMETLCEEEREQLPAL